MFNRQAFGFPLELILKQELPLVGSDADATKYVERLYTGWEFQNINGEKVWIDANTWQVLMDAIKKKFPNATTKDWDGSLAYIRFQEANGR
jgi:hypothetical protein